MKRRLAWLIKYVVCFVLCMYVSVCTCMSVCVYVCVCKMFRARIHTYTYTHLAHILSIFFDGSSCTYTMHTRMQSRMQQDRVVRETNAKRNELESYIYDVRGQVCMYAYSYSF